MNILLIGSGGREHALAWKLSQSSNCNALYCAPGNAGIEQHAKCIDISVDDIDGLVDFAKKNDIGLVVIGPEAPLVLGLADRLNNANIPAFGPSEKAAQLEGSKSFMKDLCTRYNIPTAAYGHFTNEDKAIAFIKKTGAPIVVKADGLAAGKGVIIAETENEAINAVKDMLSGNQFGEAGHSVVVEEFLDGEELSFFAITDGKTVRALTSAQDHKRAYDDDKGPNTGGMGAYSPAHMMTESLHQKIMDTIIHPTVKGMEKDDCAYKGVLYAGIMLVNGEPKLLEYNARFGDPECQVIMKRLNNDLVDLCLAVANNTLSDLDDLIWSDQSALCVVMAANGYPSVYQKHTVLRDLDKAGETKNVTIFHAGTDTDDNGNYINIGGRVLGVTAIGQSFTEARDSAYKAIQTINWPDGFYRKDIGWRAAKALDKNTVDAA